MASTSTCLLENRTALVLETIYHSRQCLIDRRQIRYLAYCLFAQSSPDLGPWQPADSVEVLVV